MTSSSSEIHYSTRLSSGKHWSLRLRRGLSLQLSTESSTSNVAMVLYNADNLLERYNAPDTLKCQHTFHLTQGHCLYSDMGRVLASITCDTAQGHESICGNSTRQQVETRFGHRSYQKDRNDWHQNGHDAFTVELSKYGLGRADLPANINWFSRCAIEESGKIELDEQAVSKRTVHLRLEMDCLVIMHTCPHPMLEAEDYPQMDITVALANAAPMKDDDECLNSCDENRRGFHNNRIYHLGFA
ncbi:MAG: urea amidolyase associated protein UAAP1 [Granulosicoccus sp.]